MLVVNLFLLAAPETDEQATAAGELTVALAEDPVLDPHRGGLPNSWVVARALHRGLYAFPAEVAPAGRTPVPDLALEMPEEVGDGIYELHVRAGTFSDGAVFEVADVIASIRRLQRSGVGVARFLAPIETVRAVGTAVERRIRIVTTRPMPELAWVLAHPQAAILRSSVPSRVGPLGPPGLGPYRVDARALQRSVELRRNTRWIAADDPVRAAIPDRIVFEVAATPPGTAAIVQRGDAHAIGDPGPPDLYLRDAPTVEVRRCTRLVAIDHRAQGLESLATRRRIQATLLGTSLPTDGTVRAFGVLPPAVTGARTTMPTISGAGSAPARTLTLAGSATPRDRRELTEIAERLRAAGIEVAVERRAPELHARLLRAPSSVRPDLLLFTWCADWPGLAGRTFLEALTGTGALAPRGDTLSRALATARTTGGEQAAAAWANAENALTASATLIPVGWPAEIAAFNGLQPPEISPMWPQGDPTNLDPGS